MTKKAHSFKIDFSNEKVTSFGGLALVERLASRLGLWGIVDRGLPARRGCRYDWASVLKAMTAGLLTGSRGLSAGEEVREDGALLSLLSIDGAPEEAQAGRIVEDLGAPDAQAALADVQATWARRVLSRARRTDLLRHGFFPVFADGTLLEGSRRREGSTYIDEKGWGMMWATIFAGPLIVAQSLAAEGQGEQTLVRAMLRGVVEDVLKPLRLHKKALLLIDSLFGDGPTLDEVEQLRLHYVAGANKLDATRTTLEQQPDFVWQSTGAVPELNWAESALCQCWIQCENWDRKRLLVGRRWRREGELLFEYSGVMTDLCDADVAHLTRQGRTFAEAIWLLYDAKAGMEDYYKDTLEDLGLHHPPSQSYERNAGFYSLATLAHTLGAAVDLIGGKSHERGSNQRKDGRARRHAKPRRMRLWRLRRRLFALPGRVAQHAKVLRVTLLGLGNNLRDLFGHYWLNVCRC